MAAETIMDAYVYMYANRGRDEARDASRAQREAGRTRQPNATESPQPLPGPVANPLLFEPPRIELSALTSKLSRWLNSHPVGQVTAAPRRPAPWTTTHPVPSGDGASARAEEPSQITQPAQQESIEEMLRRINQEYEAAVSNVSSDSPQTVSAEVAEEVTVDDDPIEGLEEEKEEAEVQSEDRDPDVGSPVTEVKLRERTLSQSSVESFMSATDLATSSESVQGGTEGDDCLGSDSETKVKCTQDRANSPESLKESTEQDKAVIVDVETADSTSGNVSDGQEVCHKTGHDGEFKEGNLNGSDRGSEHHPSNDNAEDWEAATSSNRMMRRSSDSVFNIIDANYTEMLEKTIAGQQRETKELKDKLASHDAAAKRAIASLQGELKHRVEQAQKQYDDVRREKEGMVMKFALAEQKNIEAADRVAKMEAHVRDVNREREQLVVRYRGMKADKDKAVEAYEAKLGDVAALRREIDRQKDLVETQEVKTKWAQNKLKAEIELHKETKAKVEELQRRVLQTKEEAEQIRQDCQAMIRTYQESEEIKSNSLDLQLREKLTELEAQKQEKSDQEEVYTSMRRELESLKLQLRDALRDLKTHKDKVQCLDAERICQEQSMEQYRSTVHAQKAEIKEMEASLAQLRDIRDRYNKEEEKASRLGQRVTELEQSNKDLVADMEGCAKRESEHLAFSQKISNKNAQLQAENTTIQAKLDAICSELEKTMTRNDELSDANIALEKQLGEVQQSRTEETSKLQQQLQAKTKIAEELSIQVEDERDAMRTLKRRHQANIKDLTRQLQQAKKRLEGSEPRAVGGGAGGDRDSVSAGSMGSRASSTGSLDKAGQGASGSRESSQEPTPQEECPPIVEYVEVDKQMLMEKIVKLQRAHARKNDKLEFMEDHITQLLNEVQKKAKLIQHYAINLEPGALAPESMDQNKMALSKKGGIMASVYSQHSQDGAMTLDLSLQITQKLQAVLEDTLLKNITLKDNLDTLGQEIARLSQENRQLQLRLQGIKPRS